MITGLLSTYHLIWNQQSANTYICKVIIVQKDLSRWNILPYDHLWFHTVCWIIRKTSILILLWGNEKHNHRREIISEASSVWASIQDLKSSDSKLCVWERETVYCSQEKRIITHTPFRTKRLGKWRTIEHKMTLYIVVFSAGWMLGQI